MNKTKMIQAGRLGGPEWHRKKDGWLRVANGGEARYATLWETFLLWLRIIP